MTLADTPISRLESLLTDSSMTRYVDTVVMRTADGFRAASATGAVDFCEATDGSIEIDLETGVLLGAVDRLVWLSALALAGVGLAVSRRRTSAVSAG